MYKTTIAAIGLLLGVFGAAQAATWDEIVNAGTQSRDWLTYGGDLGQDRYWPSTAINTTNVSKLKVKWIFQTGVLGSFENTPIVEKGVMYVTTPFNHAFAIDAATGKQIWQFEQKLGTVRSAAAPTIAASRSLGTSSS